jgi:Tol biopolymer transport system component
MGTRLPYKLLYTMAVILAALTMLFLILSAIDEISGLAVFSSSSQTKDQPRIEATGVDENMVVHGCDGSLALRDAEGLTGRIAYVCNGDIYRMNLATGEAARLLRGTNYSWFDWSPGGKKIAWADEFGDLWVTGADGASPSPVGNESLATSPDWSPDGKTLAFVSAGEPEKWAGLATIPVNSTGFQKTILSQGEDLDDAPIGSMDWSPDGKKIVFNVIDGSPDAKPGIYAVNTNGTDLTKISRPGIDPGAAVKESDGNWLDPTYSPDGKRIAFVKGWGNGQIYTMTPNGTDARQVTHDDGGHELQSWSPGGKKILYEILSNGHRDLFVINADGTGKRRLTTVRSSAKDLNLIHNVLWRP